MFEMFVAVWLMFGADGQLVAQLVSHEPLSAAECMATVEDESNRQYATGVAIMNRLPFKKIEATCAVFEPPGEDA